VVWVKVTARLHWLVTRCGRLASVKDGSASHSQGSLSVKKTYEARFQRKNPNGSQSQSNVIMNVY
jgi:hypothetical protein